MRLLNANQPFSPARVPFFYGWVILGASTLGVIMSIPGQTMGVSVFTDPLLAATSMTRLQLANAYLVGTLGSALLLPQGGRLLDRFGARATALGAALGLALTLLVLSVIDKIALGVSGWAPEPMRPWVPAIVLALAFTALRFSGQGMLTMVSRIMLGKWFDRRRGLATSIRGIFVAFAFAIAPQVLNAWIGATGFRMAWVGMAVVITLTMGIFGWALYRDNPEECGLQMDGAAPDELEKGPPEAANTRGEALKTPIFWAVTLTLSIQAMVVTGFTFHIVDIGAEVQMSADDVVKIFFPVALCSTVAGALMGWLADRSRIRVLLAMMLVAELIGYFGAANLHEMWGLALAVMGLGMAGGLFSPIGSIALPRLFGRLHLGSIAGIQMMVLVMGSALGPTGFALSRDLLGSYRPGLYACLLLPVSVLILTAVARHPRDKPRAIAEV